MLHRGNLDAPPGQRHLHILVLLLAVHGDVNLAALLALDVVVHQNGQALVGHHLILHLVEDIAGLHSRLKGRRVLKHTHNGAQAGVPVLAQHGADAGVNALGALLHLLVILSRVILGIWVVQTGKHPLVDVILHILHILVVEEIPVDDILNQGHFRVDLFIIQLVPSLLLAVGDPGPRLGGLRAASAPPHTPAEQVNPQRHTHHDQTGEYRHKSAR